MIAKTKIGVLVIFLTSTAGAFAQQRAMGLEVDRARDERVELIDKPQGFGENLPKRVSLEQYVPEVGDQGQYGTCGGWSSAYYTASIEFSILSGSTNKTINSAYAYDPLYTYKMALGEETSTCASGTYLDALCDELYYHGAKRVKIDGMYCGDDIDNMHDESRSILDFTGYDRVFNWYDSWEENTTAICQMLANNHPVLMGMNLPESFFDIGSNGLFSPTQKEKDEYLIVGGHAMTIVGYDDDKFGGAFRVVNSWGENWGDNGFCWVKYEDFHIFAIAAYAFETELKPSISANNYRDMDVKKNGHFEGFAYDDKPSKGIYINENKKRFGGGTGYMKKLVKKNGGTLLYDNYDDKHPIAAIIGY